MMKQRMVPSASDREPDHRVDEPQPLAEHEAAENAGHLAGDGRDDDLQGLDHDEDEGRRRSPLDQLLLHVVVVVEQAVGEAIRGRVRPNEPRKIRAHAGGESHRQRQPSARGQSRLSVTPRAVTLPATGRDRSARTSRSAATVAAALGGVRPAP